MVGAAGFEPATTSTSNNWGKQGLTCAKQNHSYDIIAHELEKIRKQLSGSE